MEYKGAIQELRWKSGGPWPGIDLKKEKEGKGKGDSGRRNAWR